MADETPVLCGQCKHHDVDLDMPPCSACTAFNDYNSIGNWEPREDSLQAQLIAKDATIKELREALRAAESHLDYCGYGDSYEAEGAYDAKLPEQIAAALTKQERTNDKRSRTSLLKRV